jgi:hypothetical protein
MWSVSAHPCLAHMVLRAADLDARHTQPPHNDTSTHKRSCHLPDHPPPTHILTRTPSQAV